MIKNKLQLMNTAKRLVLTNSHQSTVVMTNLGASLVSWTAKDTSGQWFDILLGYDDLEAYATCPSYLGATLGRVAGRIGGAGFEIDGKLYPLAANDGPNHLHGGLKGFNRKLWRVHEHRHISQGDGFPAMVHLGLQSHHLEEGYPGHLLVNLRITYNDQYELSFEFDAVTDRPTPVNLSLHPYFNLSGTQGPAAANGGAAGESTRTLSLPSIVDHRLQIRSHEITAVDASLIPTGDRLSVVGTPFDLRQSTVIGAVVGQNHEQILKARGLDHNFILIPGSPDGEPMVRVEHPTNGRALELWTDQPGVQCYTGNWLDGSIRGKHGLIYGHRSGFCLEPQAFPDAPHHPGFPSIILRPGQEYHHKTRYRLITTV